MNSTFSLNRATRMNRKKYECKPESATCFEARMRNYGFLVFLLFAPIYGGIALGGGLAGCVEQDRPMRGGRPPISNAMDVGADAAVTDGGPDTESTSINDTGDDTASVVMDAAPENGLPLKDFGESCDDNSECASRICNIDGPGEGTCTRRCNDDCPTGWSCVLSLSSGVDEDFVCMKDADTLCDGCNEDNEDENDNPDVDPSAPEICDGMDNNGNHLVDEGCDDDSDGFCDQKMSVEGTPDVCPNGGGDCNDNTQEVNPGVPEVCDGLIDDDCDGEIDEGCDCIEYQSRPCGIDRGECRSGTQTCTAGEWGECLGLILPVTESCDGLDNDCDGDTDEGLGTTTCGQGQCAHSIQNCAEGVPQNCNPFEGATPEVCDGIDNDCDGVVDNAPGELCSTPSVELADGFPKVLDGIGFAVSMDASGSVWVAGARKITSGCADGPGTDAALWKFDRDGNLAAGFPKLRNGDAGGDCHDYGYAVVNDASGNVWMTGVSYGRHGRNQSGVDRDFALWKFDSNGNLSIVKTQDNIAGGAYNDAGQAIAVDTSGNVWVTGYSNGPSSTDLFLFKFLSDGTVAPAFPKIERGAGGRLGLPSSSAVAIDKAGNIWVVGCARPGTTQYDIALFKFDSSGNRLSGFPKYFDGEDGLALEDAPLDMVLDAQGNLWVTGYVHGGYGDFALWKFDTNGDLSMGFPIVLDGIGGVTGNQDYGTGVAVDSSGFVWVAAGTRVFKDNKSPMEFALLKYDSDGNLVPGFPIVYDDANIDIMGTYPEDIAIDSDNRVWVPGHGPYNEHMLLWRFE